MANTIRRFNGTTWDVLYSEAALTKNIFSTIAVSGQSSVEADSPTDTLTLAAGTGLTITTNSVTDTITFASNGTSASTGNALVLRDGAGGFSAGTVSVGELSSAGPVTATTLTSSSGDVSISAAAGNFRSLKFQSSGSLRWNLYVTSAAESGSNAGSNLALSRHDDAGASLGNVLSINRSTGDVSVGSSVAVAGVTSVTSGQLASSATLATGVYLATGDGLSLTSNARIILSNGTQSQNMAIDNNAGSLRVFGPSGTHFTVQNDGITKIVKLQHDYIGQATAGATQSFASTSNSTPTFTQVQFTGVDAYDYANMHDPASNNGTRIMIPIAGVWRFHTQIPFGTQSTTGRRIVRITRYNTAAPTTILDWWEISTDPGGTVNGSTDPTFVATATMLCDAPSGGNSDFVVVEFAQSSGVSFVTRYGSGVGAKCAWELVRAS